MSSQVGFSRIAAAGVVLFVILVYATSDGTVPVLPDEVGYLAIAKYLATGEALNLSTLANYSFGHAVLLTPAFWVTSDVATVYRIGVVVSCLATAMVPVVLIGIAEKIGQPRSLFLVACSFLVAVFPAYSYHNAVVWSDATFRLAFLLTVFAFTSAWVAGRPWRWVLFGAMVIILYAIHPRALGIVPVAFVALVVARAMQKATWTEVGASAAAMLLLWFGVDAANNHFEIAIWGRDLSQSGRIAGFLQALMTPYGFKSAVAVSIGQLWSLIASSLGFFVVGLLACWQMVQSRPAVRPMILFSVAAMLAITAASVMQMMTPGRIDHVIYGRYVDGASTVIVWLGLVWLGQREKQASAIVLVIGSVLVTAVIVLKPFIHAPLAPVVAPTISGLLWVDFTGPGIHLAPLLTIIAMGSLMAVAVSSSSLALSSRPWTALAVVAVAVIGASSCALLSAKRAHTVRANYVKATAAIYAKANGRPIHWDVSDAGDGETTIDQFSAASETMPPSDIAATDIPIGDAAVVPDGFQKAGYSLLGDLPNATKLIVRSQ
ncbi:hypothetical protein D3227_04875 [Mesorhizobium waimense]|uniref:Glycosyltransferase RgtA/B/C/D-like domain-containing protein n=1 Tax=Mesorhizobium waimense TaxID=1300307 RepID=A0A3A5L926_9HYPH|nr:hypothetical protein [Mesorhizobium waimense]RJT42014.1 hypothetical protein D3227_04875 [Mesorhizobium waimense]